MIIFFYEFSVYFVEFDIFLLLYSFAAFEKVDLWLNVWHRDTQQIIQGET